MTIFMSFWSFSPKLLTFVNFIHLASLVFGLIVKIWLFMRQLRTFFCQLFLPYSILFGFGRKYPIFAAEFSHFWGTRNWNYTISFTFLGEGKEIFPWSLIQFSQFIDFPLLIFNILISDAVHLRTGEILRRPQRPDKRNSVIMLNDDGKRKNIYQHRIVALSFTPFVGNPDNLCVIHLDENKNNNSLINLQVVEKLTFHIKKQTHKKSWQKNILAKSRYSGTA